VPPTAGSPGFNSSNTLSPQTFATESNNRESEADRFDLQRLEDLQDPATQRFLQSELDNSEAFLKSVSQIRSALQQELAEERLKSEPSSLCSTPLTYGIYDYVTCQDRGRPQPLLMRSTAGSSELVLDFNELGSDPLALAINGVRIAPDSSQLIFSISSESGGLNGLYKFEIVTKEIHQLSSDQSSRFEWGNFGEVFAISQHPAGYEELLRYTHNNPAPERLLVNRQPDARFELRRSSDSNSLIVSQRTALESAVYMIDLTKSGAFPLLAVPMRAGILIELDIHDSQLFMRSNEDTPNFTLRHAPKKFPVEDSRLIYTPPTTHTLGAFLPTAAGVLVIDQSGWQDSIKRINMDGKILASFTPQSGPAIFRTPPLYRSSDTSFRITSVSPCDDENSHTLDSRTLLELAPSLSSSRNEPCNYQEISLPAKDGTPIPVSIIAAKDPKALLLTVYGAYGTRPSPLLNPGRRALLRHGISIAQAQVRGGGFYGPSWHKAGVGKLKRQALEDFITVAMGLRDLDRVETQKIFAFGRSAGATLVATATMQRPELFAGSILEMPFLDLTRTLLDPSQPLAVRDRAEWGDVRNSSQRSLIEGISPMSIGTPQDLPPFLIVTSLNDETVPYWHAAKWVAKLRKEHREGLDLNLLIDPDATHSEARDEHSARQREIIEAAFIVDLL